MRAPRFLARTLASYRTMRAYIIPEDGIVGEACNERSFIRLRLAVISFFLRVNFFFFLMAEWLERLREILTDFSNVKTRFCIISTGFQVILWVYL